jgi:hypothetical protein
VSLAPAPHRLPSRKTSGGCSSAGDTVVSRWRGGLQLKVKQIGGSGASVQPKQFHGPTVGEGDDAGGLHHDDANGQAYRIALMDADSTCNASRPVSRPST